MDGRRTFILGRHNRAQAILAMDAAPDGWALDLSSPEARRSRVSHDHYFALVSEGWLNLPEGGADRFPTADHLRKYALIKTGYRDERSIVCASRAEALRVAAFVKPMDEHAVVVASEAVVTVYTAKSQSMKAMGKKVFQESKDAVLGILEQMIGASLTQSPAARDGEVAVNASPVARSKVAA